MKIFMLSAVLVLLSACVSIPKKLQVPENTPLTAFANVRSQPLNNLSNTVRWGGVIASVTNNADNTMIEIVHFELGSSGRPKQKNETQGRFKLYFSGLLDPVIYKKGKSITAVGIVSTPEKGKIGENEYLYPVMKAKNIHLWKDIQKVDIRVIHKPLWHQPSFWRFPNYYAPYRPIIIQSSNKKNMNEK